MSAVFPINVDQRWRSYAASAGQVLFSVPFPFQDDDDITVLKIAPDGTQTTLSRPANYTLTGAGNPGGGSFTLAAPALAGEKFLPVGAAVLDRVLSIVRGGRYNSAATDSDLDRLMIIAQEQQRDIDRSWKSRLGQAGQEMPSPDPSKILGWNVDGELENKNAVQLGLVVVRDEDDMASNDPANPPSQQSTKAYVDSRVIDEDDMATNSATRPPSQQSTKAYVDAVAGQILPPITPADASRHVAVKSDLSGYEYVAGGGGIFAVVTDYGAQGDGVTDDLVAIHSARDALASTGGIVFFPPGIYRITDQIVGLPGVFFQGAGAGNFLFPNQGKPMSGSQIVWGGGVAPTKAVFRFAAADDFIYATGLDGFLIDGNGEAGFAIWGSSVCNSRFKNIVSRQATNTHYRFDALDSTATTYSNSNEMANLFWGSTGSVNGFVLDGVASKGGCAFNTVTNVRGSFTDGDGFAVLKGDDNVFVNCAASRNAGGTGNLLRLGASSNAARKAAIGNWFFGFRGGGGIGVPVPILAEAGEWSSRGNHVFMTGVDNQVTVTIQAGAEIYYYDTGGYNNSNTPSRAVAPSTTFANYNYDAQAQVEVMGYGATRPLWLTRHAQGTPAAPTTLTNGTPVMARLVQAWLPTAGSPAFGSVFNEIVDILGVPSATSYPARWRLQLTKTNTTVLETVLTINPTTMDCARPVKFPSFTVATLPAAATVGAGTQVYCTDGNAGTPCMAFSNGSAWRRMHQPGTDVSAT